MAGSRKTPAGQSYLWLRKVRAAYGAAFGTAYGAAYGGAYGSAYGGAYGAAAAYGGACGAAYGAASGAVAAYGDPQVVSMVALLVAPMVPYVKQGESSQLAAADAAGRAFYTLQIDQTVT